MFLIDPKTKEESVSLTLLIVTFCITIITKILEMAKVISSSEIMNEVLYSFVLLYFGRRFSFKGKLLDGNSDIQEEKK